MFSIDIELDYNKSGLLPFVTNVTARISTIVFSTLFYSWCLWLP